MSTTYTPHYNFGKQENYSDLFSMEVITDNWDSLDRILYELDSGKQETLSSAQLAAVNSGITADIVAADTAALIKLVDEGTKNKLKNTAYTREVNGVSYTVNADGSVAITSDGTNTLSQLYLTRDDTSLSAGEYVLSGAPGGSTTTYDVRVKIGDQTTINHSGGSAFVSDGSAATISIIVRANQTLDITIKPMICTKAAWDISRAYVPYRPSYDELVARVVALENA